MSICDRNSQILDMFAAGLGDLEEFDHLHAAKCRSCRKALEENKLLHDFLRSYEAKIDSDVSRQYSDEKLRSHLHSNLRTRPSLYLTSYRWLAIAASILLVVGISYISFHIGRESALDSNYIQTLKSEAMRAEIHSYLSKSQIFLLALLDKSHDCSDSNDFERAAARRLLLQQRLLEPQLGGLEFEDLRSLVDEIGLLLTEVSNTDGCFHEDDINLWRRVIESRSTLMKLNLLQMKDRI